MVIKSCPKIIAFLINIWTIIFNSAGCFLFYKKVHGWILIFIKMIINKD